VYVCVPARWIYIICAQGRSSSAIQVYGASMPMYTFLPKDVSPELCTRTRTHKHVFFSSISQPLLPNHSSLRHTISKLTQKTHSVRVCMCVHVCVYVCACVCVRVCMRTQQFLRYPSLTSSPVRTLSPPAFKRVL
jgi:hypothetical protein